MKLFSSLVLIAAVGGAATEAQAARPDPALTGCAAKHSEIVNEIAETSWFNWSKKRGLEKALKEHDAHCTDAGLRAEREAKVAKAQAEIAEREADLKAAEANGDADKIAKRKAKLAESQAELKQAELELQR